MEKFEFAHAMLPGSLELAYIGDAVFELRVRETLIKQGGNVRDMHKKAIARVCAAAQSEALSRVEPALDESERAVVRRARNARQSPTKNAELADYHRATAFEALIGYLYITSRRERLDEILNIALEDNGNEL